MGIGGKETGLWGRGHRREERIRERQRQVEKRKERKKETGGWQGPPFKREPSVHTQKVCLVAPAEDANCQNLKGRLVQMPEY